MYYHDIGGMKNGDAGELTHRDRLTVATILLASGGGNGTR